MITLSKSGNTVTFTFDENSGYLQNGTIDVPVNSLSLILDESNMATFRKSASNDIFVSANLAEFGMSKSDLIDFYKTSMVGSSGGGGGDITSGEVQTMIDESISGKADSVSAVSSAEYVSSSTTINFKNVEGTVISSIDASDFVIDGMIDDVRIETISGVTYLVIDFNTASGKEDIQIPLTDIFDPSNYYTKAEVDAAVSGLAESSAVTLEISAAVSGKADSSSLATVATSGSYNDLLDKPTIPTVPTNVSAFNNDAGYITSDALSGYAESSAVTAEINSAVSGKQDTLIAGDNITISGNVISATGGGGGGKAIEAGRGISVTTGETADTVSFNLAIYDRGNISVSECHNENNNIPICNSSFCHLEHPSGSIGDSSNCSHKEGSGSKIGDYSANSHVEGYKCEVGSYSPYSHAEGQYTKTSNQSEHASGQYNVSNKASFTFGDSGNTLFSVGNGTSNNARHNAFEIRQNGDIYISSGGTDIKLQDNLGGGTVSSAITSGDTNAVAGGAVYDATYMDEYESWSQGNQGNFWVNTLKFMIYPYDDNTENPIANVMVSYFNNGNAIETSFSVDFENKTTTILESSFDVEFTTDGKFILTYTPPLSSDYISYISCWDYPYYTSYVTYSIPANFTNSVLYNNIIPYTLDTNSVAKDAFNNATIDMSNILLYKPNGGWAQLDISQCFSDDFEKGVDGKIHQNIEVPVSSEWSAVTIIDDSTKETEEINANQVKITLTGTPSDGNIIYVNDVDDNWGSITYNSGSWTDDTQLGLTIVLDGNVLYLTASNDQLIKAISADDNPELIDSVQKFAITTQDLIPYVQATKSDLGGLKLQQVTQAQYDALVSGGTIDNSTLYVVTDS